MLHQRQVQAQPHAILMPFTMICTRREVSATVEINIEAEFGGLGFQLADKFAFVIINCLVEICKFLGNGIVNSLQDRIGNSVVVALDLVGDLVSCSHALCLFGGAQKLVVAYLQLRKKCDGFVVRVDVRQGEVRAQGFALILREAGAWPRVVWQMIE